MEQTLVCVTFFFGLSVKTLIEDAVKLLFWQMISVHCVVCNPKIIPALFKWSVQYFSPTFGRNEYKKSKSDRKLYVRNFIVRNIFATNAHVPLFDRMTMRNKEKENLVTSQICYLETSLLSNRVDLQTLYQRLCCCEILPMSPSHPERSKIQFT